MSGNQNQLFDKLDRLELICPGISKKINSFLVIKNYGFTPLIGGEEKFSKLNLYMVYNIYTYSLLREEIKVRLDNY